MTSPIRDCESRAGRDAAPCVARTPFWPARLMRATDEASSSTKNRCVGRIGRSLARYRGAPAYPTWRAGAYPRVPKGRASAILGEPSSVRGRVGAAPAMSVPAHEIGARLTFESLGLSADLVRLAAEEGYEQPTPVQEAAIPEVLAGRDVLAAAQTGTGKTA